MIHVKYGFGCFTEFVSVTFSFYAGHIFHNSYKYK